METLEKSRMCRLCGKHSGIAVDIFDKNENHVRKINAILPILVHEMDSLPKQMCHRCSYKLEEFYNFYVDCAKADTDLKSQLSWMRKETPEEKIITPMVKMNRFKIKTEPPDNSDSIDSSNVFGHISESSLLFRGSILQHNYDPITGPITSCLRCQCLCNENVKIGPKLQKLSKKSSNANSVTEAHSSSFISKTSSKINDLNKSKSTNNFGNSKNLCEISNFKQVNVKGIQGVNVKDNKRIEIENIHVLRPDKLNRALRPRKCSVDYMGQKKKGIASNIKEKFKNKIDLIDPSLVNCVKISHSNSIHSGPIIKLEKVDDTMRTLRTRKNLEEFDKKVQELQMRKKLHRGESHNRKSLQKDEKQRRKSLQKEEKHNRKNLVIDVSVSSENYQKEENQMRRILQNEENQDKNYLQTEENESSKSLQAEKNVNNKQYLNSNVPCDVKKNIFTITELKIKEEVINKTIENHKMIQEQPMQEKILEIDLSKEQKAQKPMDRIPLCAVVKLEKDYTCNVDYPRIKIKRHLAVANPSKSECSGLEISEEQKSIFQLKLNKKSLSKSDGDLSPKNLRSKEKRLKTNNEQNKLGKVSKKKNKQLNLSNSKRTFVEKNISVVPQTDVKRYCEECDTCFRNKELYQLHPCYQK